MNKPRDNKNPTDHGIRVVFFDIGKVLLEFDVGTVLRRFAGAVRSHPIKIAHQILSRKLIDGVERGNIPPKRIFRVFKDDFGYAGDYEAFRLLWCDQFTLNRKSAGILRRVRRRCRVYLLSNTNQLHFDYIREKYAFARQVDGALLSHRLHLRKPEPAIYHAALKRARVKASQALFIDDMKGNVAAARRLGWHGIHFKNAGQLESDLKKLGVL
ncbi:MAG: HAD family phosphatase [Elusimicrobiota bacterium]